MNDKINLKLFRKNKMSLVFLVLFLIQLIIPSPISNAAPMKYFILGPGSYWVYESSSNSAEWVTRRSISDEWDFIGLEFTVRYEEEHFYDGSEEAEWQNRMWLGKSGNSLTWWGFEDNNAKVIAKNGLIYVTEPVIEGDVHRGSTKVELTIKSDPPQNLKALFRANYTIDVIETISVPAGTFENCIKIHEQELTPDGIADFYVWYAPNVGPIKFEYPLRENRTDEMTEYKLEQNNDPWNDWLLPKVPTIAITSGVVIFAIIVTIVIIKKRKSN